MERIIPHYIGNIEKGSPSEMAGLKKYDKILTMNNEKITFLKKFILYWMRTYMKILVLK